MCSHSELVRGFVAAWRRGDTETARRIKKTAWAQHREHPTSQAPLDTVTTIYDIESTIPLGPTPSTEGEARV